MEASGWRGLDGVVRYDHLGIGTPEKPWDGEFRFSILLTNGAVLRSTDFTLENVKRICPGDCVYPEVEEGWPAGSTNYTSPEWYSFLFSGSGALLRFRTGIKHTGLSHAAIGDIDQTYFYRVSWTHRQLYKLFGTNFTVVSARSML